MTDVENENIKLKVVISPLVASRLCDLGYPIVKIKPKRDKFSDNYNCNTVFLFEETKEFLEDFYALANKEKNNKGENKNG